MMCKQCSSEWVVYSARTECCGHYVKTGKPVPAKNPQQWYCFGAFLCLLYEGDKKERKLSEALERRHEPADLVGQAMKSAGWHDMSVWTEDQVEEVFAEKMGRWIGGEVVED